MFSIVELQDQTFWANANTCIKLEVLAPPIMMPQGMEALGCQIVAKVWKKLLRKRCFNNA